MIQSRFQSILLGPRNRKHINKELLPKDSGNQILHWDSLQKLIETNIKCSHCDSTVSFDESAVEITMPTKLTCKNKSFILNHSNEIRRTKFTEKRSNKSFTINYQLVLGWIQMGCRLTKADIFLTFWTYLTHTNFTQSIFKNCTTLTCWF